MAAQNLLPTSVLQALEAAYEKLWLLANNDLLFENAIMTSFGEGVDASAFRANWGNRDFSDFPEIEIRSATEINGANGAFATATGKIYLAQEFIDENSSKPDAIVSVVLEEYGHFVDFKINKEDAIGDEGEIFSALVQGKTLTDQELTSFRTENDKATVVIDNQTIQIEQDEYWDGANRDWGGNRFTEVGFYYEDAKDNGDGYMIAGLKGSGEYPIYGYGGNDTIIGGQTTDYISGGDGNDKLLAGGGDDTVDGDDGDDTLYSGSGLDRLNGGNDWDVASYENHEQGIIVKEKENWFDPRTASTRGALLVQKNNSSNQRGAEEDLLWDVEGIEGTNKNDYIVAQVYEYSNIALNVPLNTGLKVIRGHGGEDRLVVKNYKNLFGEAAYHQENWLYGDDGKDTLYADLTKDGYPQHLFGGNDNDQDLFVLGGSFEADSSEDIIKAIADLGIGVFASINPVTGVIAAGGALLKTLLWKDNTSGVTSDAVFINDFGFSKVITNNITNDFEIELDEDILVLPKLNLEKKEDYDFDVADNSVRIEARIDSIKEPIIIAYVATDSFDEASKLADALSKSWSNNKRDKELQKFIDTALKSPSQEVNTGPKIVGGYYPEWGIYDRNFQVQDVPADELTHLFYAFAQIDQNGKAAFFDPWASKDKPFPGDTLSQDLKGNLNQLRILKEQNPDLKNMLSIGGWSLSGPFSTIAATPESRETFAKSAVELMSQYRTSTGRPIFDGLDIDWEFPVGGGPDRATVDAMPGAQTRANKEVSNSPADKQNYSLLLEAVRQELNNQEIRDNRPIDYQLSIASAAGAENVENVDMKGIAQHIDFFNVMTYDFHGPSWEPNQTNHQAALYGPGSDDVDSAIQTYVMEADSDPNDAFERSDIVMGAPLYGRGWVGVPNVNDGLLQPASGTAPGTWEAGVLDYEDLYNRLKNQPGIYKEVWDDVAQVPYIYSSADGGMFSTYENVQSIGAKTDYVRDNGLGGMFFWDLSSDLPGGHPDSLVSKASYELGVSV